MAALSSPLLVLVIMFCCASTLALPKRDHLGREFASPDDNTKITADLSPAHEDLPIQTVLSNSRVDPDLLTELVDSETPAERSPSSSSRHLSKSLSSSLWQMVLNVIGQQGTLKNVHPHHEAAAPFETGLPSHTNAAASFADGPANSSPALSYENLSSVAKRSAGNRSRCCYVDVFCIRSCLTLGHHRSRHRIRSATSNSGA